MRETACDDSRDERQMNHRDDSLIESTNHHILQKPRPCLARKASSRDDNANAACIPSTPGRVVCPAIVAHLRLDESVIQLLVRCEPSVPRVHYFPWRWFGIVVVGSMQEVHRTIVDGHSFVGADKYLVNASCDSDRISDHGSPIAHSMPLAFVLPCFSVSSRWYRSTQTGMYYYKTPLVEADGWNISIER